jgi:hypothetical protein
VIDDAAGVCSLPLFTVVPCHFWALFLTLTSVSALPVQETLRR